MQQYKRDYGRTIRVAAWRTEQADFDPRVFETVSYSEWRTECRDAFLWQAGPEEELLDRLGAEPLLRRLTPRQAQVFRLLYVEGVSVTEAARRLQLDTATVYQTRMLGVKRLQIYPAAFVERLLTGREG